MRATENKKSNARACHCSKGFFHVVHLNKSTSEKNMSVSPTTGRCRCGALEIPLVGAPVAVFVCHCSQCLDDHPSDIAKKERLVGLPWCAMPRIDLSVMLARGREGGVPLLRRERKSDYAERYYCAKCGDRCLLRYVGCERWTDWVALDFADPPRRAPSLQEDHEQGRPAQENEDNVDDLRARIDEIRGRIRRFLTEVWGFEQPDDLVSRIWCGGLEVSEIRGEPPGDVWPVHARYGAWKPDPCRPADAFDLSAEFICHRCFHFRAREDEGELESGSALAKCQCPNPLLTPEILEDRLS